MLTIVSFIVVLLVLIFVHELGHFIAAKMVGVRVEKFSLGFPPKAISKTIGETEYQLAWLPLGGYVKMYGEDPAEGSEVPPELQARSFAHQPPWAKIIIVLAGPVFNLIFAAFLFWGIIWFSGIQHLAPVVGPVAPGSQAAEVGIRMDDVITVINGRPVKYFDALDTALAEGRGAPLNITVSRRGLPEETYRLTPVRHDVQDLFGDHLVSYDVGIGHRMKPAITRVVPGKPAAKAGLQPGDLIMTIDGRPTPDWQDVLLAIQGPVEARGATTPSTVRPLAFEIERDGRRQTLELTPELNTSLNAEGDVTYTPMVGMESKAVTLTENIGFFRAAAMGVEEAANMIRLTVLSVYKLIIGQVSAKTLGGPILIAEVTGDRARAGLIPLLNLAAFISINLGILNLLPIPMLDGGQLVFFAVEAIRRKPVSLKIREKAQWVGVALLGLLMVMVFYNDIGRLVTRMSTKTEIEPPASAPSPPPGGAAPDTTPEGSQVQ